MKRIIFITQSKGGCGKSVLTWLFAQKHPELVYLDMDDATNTTMNQLAYLNPTSVSFLSKTNTIDRGRFSDFLEHVAEHEKSVFVCDLGASISEQLPFYINDFTPEALKTALDDLKIDLEIICVVGGQNIFLACMNHLQELLGSVNKKIKIKVALNDHYYLNELQQSQFDNFCKTIKLTDVFHFNLSRDKNASNQDRVTEVLKSGKGLAGAGIMTKNLLSYAISNLPIL